MKRTGSILAAMAMVMTVTATSDAQWEPPPPMFPWADPGAVRWVINYSKMDEAQVGHLLDAGLNLIQGGSFTPEAMQAARQAGAHRMMYICSRTIYHEQLFPQHPELRDAAILTPEGDYKVIYSNPARYAGCYNRPAWLEYIKGRMDALQQTGVDCIFFDNPMTWACYCPTCREKFREYALQHTGTAYELGAEGTPGELENWFTLDSALEFFEQVQFYAHNREEPLFIVANDLTYWLVDRGVTDGVFTEAFAHPPFGRDIAACKLGLAASHGRPTGFLSYIPRPVKQARGREIYHAPGATNVWMGLPVAEEYALGCATGIALGGNYMPNMSLMADRTVPDMTRPREDQAILDACDRYARFAERWEGLLAGQRPGSRVGVLYDLTAGPRTGQILGLKQGNINELLWLLQGHGIPADVIVNSDLTSGGLAEFGAVLIDDGAMLSPAEMTGLREFVEAGGTLVLSASLDIRDRFEPREARRPISEFLPGLADSLRVQVSALELELDGYEAESAYLSQVSVWIGAATEGTASLTFAGEPGLWQFTVSYLDESRGQSSFELLVRGEVVARWTAGADDDEWHTHTSEAVALAAGDTITIRGRAGALEYARVRWLALRSRQSDEPGLDVRLGAGRAVQLAGPLESLPADELAAGIEALRAASPVSGEWPETVLVNLLHQPAAGVLSVHIVNHDFEYDDDYALTAVHPTPEITLRVADESLTVARLIAPAAEPVELTIEGGRIAVPPIETYAAVLLAPDEAALDAVSP